MIPAVILGLNRHEDPSLHDVSYGMQINVVALPAQSKQGMLLARLACLIRQAQPVPAWLITFSPVVSARRGSRV